MSKRAEEAAVEARNLIERKSVAQELRECGDDINLIKINSENSIWPVASFICNRLILRLTFIINRWSDHFCDDTKSNLSLTITQLDTLNSQFRKFIIRTPNQSEMSGILSVAVRLSTILAAEYGKYESTINKK
ncbi:MAG: hypothetical protein HZB86_02545 [Deltaproteobacteria bacterium]|nr:hypothetical protein [Deltaproteobacteria bacterium]